MIQEHKLIAPLQMHEQQLNIIVSDIVTTEVELKWVRTLLFMTMRFLYHKKEVLEDL
jgi:hypothetical protein